MTYKEFFEVLKKTTLKWVLVRGAIRTRKREDVYRHCPITAVCEFLTSSKYKAGEEVEAGKLIGLTSHKIATISIACDWEKYLRPKQEYISKKILEIIKL